MKSHPLPLQQLCVVAMDAARSAGAYIRSTDHRQLQRHFKDAGSSMVSQIVTDVDVRSEALIREHLQADSRQWDISFVGEESLQTVAGVTPERLLKPYYWCVDPLDGTFPFMQGRPGYAVSIALVDRSGVPLLGVVYDPTDDRLWHAIKGQGAYQDGTPMAEARRASNSLMVFADASFATQKKYAHTVTILKACAQDRGLDGIEVIYGSGAVKNACQVLGYRAACYLKLPKPQEGGGSIWDFAATACIAAEAGAWVGNCHGEPLALNPPGSTFMNRQGVVYASNEGIARYVIDRL